MGECDALKKPWTSNCAVLRLTEKLDMTTSKGLKIAEKSLRAWPNRNILIWAAIPCTGGSTWQRVNEHLYAQKGDEAALKRLAHLRKEAEILWANFEKLAKVVYDRGGIIAVEWPANCMYWKLPAISKFAEKYNLSDAYINGCAYNLMSSSNLPLYKPWKVKASSSTFTSMLRRKCTGCLTHSACRGDDCKSTEGYTEEMVKRVHESFIFTIMSRQCSHLATVAVCAALVAPANLTSPPSSAVLPTAGAQSLARRESGAQGTGSQSDSSKGKSGSQGTGSSTPQ